MAAGDPILVDIPNAVFLMSAETGVLIQSYSRKTDSKEKEVFNAAVGYTIGFVDYDFFAEYDWKAMVNGSTGLMLAAPGVAISFANPSSGNGVAAGGIYTRTVSLDHQEEDFRHISGTAKQRTGVA